MSEIASGGGSDQPPDDDQIFVPEYIDQNFEPEDFAREDFAREDFAREDFAPPPPSRAFTSRGATSALKIPPHSIEAEQSVLGGLMLDNDAWFNVIEAVNSGDFYRGQHQIIFDAMTDLAAEDQPLEALTVSERLQAKGMLDKAGGITYLAEITESTPGASNSSQASTSSPVHQS